MNKFEDIKETICCRKRQKQPQRDGHVDRLFYNLCQNIYGNVALANPVSLSSSKVGSSVASPPSPALSDHRQKKKTMHRSNLRAPGSKELSISLRCVCTLFRKRHQNVTRSVPSYNSPKHLTSDQVFTCFPWFELKWNLTTCDPPIFFFFLLLRFASPGNEEKEVQT